MLAPWKKSYDKPRQRSKKQRHFITNKICTVKAIVFLVVMYGYEGWTIREGWTSKNWCFWTVMLEKTLESLLGYKEIKPVNPKRNQSWPLIRRNWWWSWSSSILATWCEELTHRKRSWCWERLKVGKEGANRGWDGWMASLTQWTWVWVNFGSWWWTGRPGMLQFMGSQSRTLLSNWTELILDIEGAGMLTGNWESRH